ncbi:MAG: choice-of-anchor D domain-containing protein [Acidobacteriaceae bacterium]
MEHYWNFWQRRVESRRVSQRLRICVSVCLFLSFGWNARAQAAFSNQLAPSQTIRNQTIARKALIHKLRVQRFLAERQVFSKNAAKQSPAQLLQAARQQNQLMLQARDRMVHANAISAHATSALTANWQAIGPAQIASAAYGKVTGRVASIAIDPSDPSGNTVYIGTTGGGVWKSTNAAGDVASVTFTPLTDTLPVFSGNAGTTVTPSLSIGAVSVQPGGTGVVLAGTGDPNDALDSYYGEGLLRSADGGLTWSLIQNSQDGVAGNHSFVGEGFAGFAWSTTTAGLVVAAVSQAARGTIVNASNAGYSVQGLYYSTDAGATWQMGTISDGGQVVQSPQSNFGGYEGNAATSVAWNPVRQRFYAAVRYHGYYESTDGIHWSRLANQPGVNLTTTNCPVNANNPGSPACPIFRGALAVQPVTGDLFALTVDLNNLDQGLWQDVCNSNGSNCASNTVSFAKQLSSTALEAGSGDTTIPQGDYNLWLAAAPAGSASTTPNDTLLFAGTEDIYRCSLAVGCSFRNTTNAYSCAAAQVAGSQHAVDFLPTPSGTAEPLLYFGNDGGLWRSTDGVNQQAAVCSADDAIHFQNLNGGLGSLAEVVSLAVNPNDPTQLVTGVGANGTATNAGTASATSTWTQLSTGEGGYTAIDPNNPLNWYISTAAGVSISACGNGAGCTAADFAGQPAIDTVQTDNDEALLDAPFLLDPQDTSNVIVGTCRIWRGPGTGGSAWSSSNIISPILDGVQQASCTGNALVRSLAAGGAAATPGNAQNTGSEVMYAGMAGNLDGGGLTGGHLFTTPAAGTASSSTAWTDLYSSTVTNDTANHGQFNPGGFDISSIAVDPHDATGQTVYSTVMGFSGSGVSEPHVYRSVDGGAHWANISSNLPNAPANSVLVDPNDANTVYVALDTGIYVTQQVTNCATPTINCWTVFGVGLPNAPVTQLAATIGGGNSLLSAATYGRGIWQIPLLSSGSATTALLAPASLTFSSQQVQTTSPAQAITITNTGSTALNIASVTTTGDFTETNNCTAAAIAPSATCTVQVAFLPSASGARSGVLTVYGNINGGGQVMAALSGTATPAASVVLNPTFMTFGNIAVGAASAVQNITISNTGAIPVNLQSPVVTGDFQIAANTCTATLPASTGCTVSITFNPTAAGTRTGSFSITDDAGTQTASLSGSGFYPATDGLSPLSLTFAGQQISTKSAAQTVILTNSGDAALTLIAVQITSGDFTATNSCGNSLVGHASCAISVNFVPKSLGAEVGTMTVTDEFRTQTVALRGTGLAPLGVSLAPASPVNFGSVGVGIASAAQTITLTNSTGVPLSLTSIAASGDFSVVAGAGTCPVGTAATVAANSACTVQVVLKPTAAGTRSGTLTVTDDSINSPQVMQLTGTGIDFQWQSNGQTSVSVASGSQAGYSLTLAPATGSAGQVAISCSGAPKNANCVLSASTANLAGNTTVTVTVATGVTASAKLVPVLPRPRHEFPLQGWLALAFPLGLLVPKRGLSQKMSARNRKVRLHRAQVPLLFLMTMVLLLVAGCGAGRAIPASGTSGSGSSGSTPTPSGTYILSVSATAAGLTRTQQLTLVVQ